MYYFRADANEHTGTGHMMRCMTIAQALSERLFHAHPDNRQATDTAAPHPDIVFICADEASAMLPAQTGFRTIVLHTDYTQMETELPALTTALTACRTGETGPGSAPDAPPKGKQDLPVLIADSYFVTDAYLAVLRAFCRVVLIDDNAERSHPADMILNYNFHADREAYAALYGADRTRLLLGPYFAPVRPQFTNREYVVRPAVTRILVLSGGSDPDNAAGEICKTLLNAFSVEITVVCGKYNRHAETLDAYAKKDARLRVLHDVKDMATLMCECDLAVSACGSTVYELCAVGLPFVCYALADNQLPLAAYLDAEGTIPYAGAFHLHPAPALSNIARLTQNLAGSYELRLSRCVAQRKLVDGKGAAHIAAQL